MNGFKMLSFTRPLSYLDGDDGGGDPHKPTSDADNALTEFEKFIERQPEEARKMYEAQLGKLRNTVSKLRDAEKAHEKDAATLKTLQEAEDKRKKEQMTELEKAKSDAADALKAKEDAERDAKEMLAALQNERLSNLIAFIASELKFTDPKDAEKLADFDPDTYIVEGKPDDKAIRKTLDELAKNKPYLLTVTDKQKGHGTPTHKQNGNNGDNKQQRGGDEGERRAPLVRI